MSRLSRSIASVPYSSTTGRPLPPDVPSILRVEGPLLAPGSAELRALVQARLRRGERTLVLSLAGVSDVDAAGVGELVRVYNMARAADGRLRVADAPARVREILQRVGLLELLTA